MQFQMCTAHMLVFIFLNQNRYQHLQADADNGGKKVILCNCHTQLHRCCKAAHTYYQHESTLCSACHHQDKRAWTETINIDGTADDADTGGSRPQKWGRGNATKCFSCFQVCIV